MRLSVKALALGVCILTLLVVVAAGCGGGTSTPVDSSPAEREAGGDVDSKFIEGDEDKTADEKDAAQEALNFVHDANAGSEFKVVDIAVADGWARVAVEEVDVPAEEAVGFGVYLRKISGGEWEVAQTGTGVSPEDLPDAPPEIFEP